MDWRYFTEDVGYVPMLRQNCLSGDIPKEVLETERFKKFRWNLIDQQGNFGYDDKYFK